MSKSFKLIKEQNITELNSVARLYSHKRTGARLLSVINDDENKVLALTSAPRQKIRQAWRTSLSIAC